MDTDFFPEMSDAALADKFNNDLRLMFGKIRKINNAINRLKTLPNVPPSVIQRYENLFQSLTNEDILLRKHINQIPQITQNIRNQIRLLVPGLNQVSDQASNLWVEIKTDVASRITAVRNAQQNESAANPSQESPVAAGPSQEISVAAGPSQAAVSELGTPESQINNYLTPMVQITMPIKLDLIGKLKLQNSLISNFLSHTSLELQIKCLKSQNNQNQIFFGINMNISPNFLNLTNSAAKKSTFVSLRVFNTSASVSRYIANNESYTTFYLGQIVRVKNNDVNISTNFGCKNMTFKKESLSFQIESRSELPFLPTIVSSKPGFYCKPQLTLSYDFFPFENSIVKTIQMNKKQNISSQRSIAFNSDVISHSKTESVAKIESGMEVDAVNLIKQSNLSTPESHILVSSHPNPVIVQPSFFQKYGIGLLFSVGLIWVVVNASIKKKKRSKTF